MNYALTAQAAIKGEQFAKASLLQINIGIAGQDCLFQSLVQLLPNTCDDQALASFRGYCRALQKHIERGGK